MITRTHPLFWTACAIVLVLSCMVAGCSSPQTAAPVTSPATPTTITIKNFAFAPVTLTVKPGATVTWVNQDGATHTIASDSGSPVAFTSDPLVNGASFQFVFTQAGTYAYHCSIHPSMKGTIIVQS